MASSNNVFCVAGFCEDGFIELLAPVVPAVIEIGTPGDPVHALAFRAAGSSVADLDLLYGILGATDAQQDIRPIFVLGTRGNIYRAYGFERPRQGILDAVVEAFATLTAVDDVSVESNPAGANLFGLVGLTSRPFCTVTINDSDGEFSQLDERELVIGAPAALFWDVSHSVLVPELIGTVAGVVRESGQVRLIFGMAARRTRAPNITD